MLLFNLSIAWAAAMFCTRATFPSRETKDKLLSTIFPNYVGWSAISLED